MIMRHAWLIIAHNEFAILQQLIDRLDSPEMDFFIHVDKKVSAQPSISVRQGKLFVLKERIDVRWGSVSQIRCEMALFRTAREHPLFFVPRVLNKRRQSVLFRAAAHFFRRH